MRVIFSLGLIYFNYDEWERMMVNKFWRRQKGFTLVEILIVIAVISLMLTIALPALLRSRVNANESAAKANLKTFAGAMESYRSAQPTPAYPTDIGDLTSATPPYLDTTWGSGTTVTKSGYDLTYVRTDSTIFALIAEPTDVGTTGNNSFCVDETALVWTSATSSGAFTASPCSGGSGAATIS